MRFTHSPYWHTSVTQASHKSLHLRLESSHVTQVTQLCYIGALGPQVQITLFVPSGVIRFAASSIIQITHNHTPNTEIAYLTGMAKNNKNSKQSIYGKSISYLCFVLELRSKMAAGTKECSYLLVLNFGSLKRDPDGNI